MLRIFSLVPARPLPPESRCGKPVGLPPDTTTPPPLCRLERPNWWYLLRPESRPDPLCPSSSGRTLGQSKFLCVGSVDPLSTTYPPSPPSTELPTRSTTQCPPVSSRHPHSGLHSEGWTHTGHDPRTGSLSDSDRGRTCGDGEPAFLPLNQRTTTSFLAERRAHSRVKGRRKSLLVVHGYPRAQRRITTQECSGCRQSQP